MAVHVPPSNSGRYGSTSGKVVGHDSGGQAIVEIDVPGRTGPRVRALPFERLHSGPGARPTGHVLLDGIDPRNVRTAAPWLMKGIMAALDRPVVGKHTAAEYIEALLQNGHEVGIVGGGPRDVLSAHHLNPRLTSSEVADLLADIDITTSATPEQVALICSQIAKEIKKGGRFSGDTAERELGMVGFGERKHGLDISSLRLAGIKGIFGRRIRDDAQGRDFACNQIYVMFQLDRRTNRLDRENARIVDATGHSVYDAKRKKLSIGFADTARMNPTLAFRYLKFMDPSRGFRSDEATRAFLRENAGRLWAAFSSDDLVFQFGRIAPRMDTHRELDEFLKKLQSVANDSGIGREFGWYVYDRKQVLHDDLTRALAERAKKKASGS